MRDFGNYILADEGTKDMMQRMLYYDTLEEVQAYNAQHREQISVIAVLQEGLSMFEDEEHYENCALYRDTIENIATNDDVRRIY